MGEFGKLDQGPSYSNLCEYSYGSRAQILENGVAQSISIYVYERDGEDRNVKVAIYNDLAGSPTTLVAQGTGIIPANTNGWVTINLSTNPNLTALTYYWLVANATIGGKVVRLYYSVNSAESIYDSTTYANFPEDPCDYVAFRDRIYSIKCTYTVAGGWTGTFMGVTNPAKINGIDAADITNVKGVV